MGHVKRLACSTATEPIWVKFKLCIPSWTKLSAKLLRVSFCIHDHCNLELNFVFIFLVFFWIWHKRWWRRCSKHIPRLGNQMPPFHEIFLRLCGQPIVIIFDWIASCNHWHLHGKYWYIGMEFIVQSLFSIWHWVHFRLALVLVVSMDDRCVVCFVCGFDYNSIHVLLLLYFCNLWPFWSADWIVPFELWTNSKREWFTELSENVAKFNGKTSTRSRNTCANLWVRKWWSQLIIQRK